MYELKEATKIFRQGSAEIRAVDGVDLTVNEGEFVVVEGPSGSGKTSLLQLLGGLDRATEGQVVFEEQDLGTLRDRSLADLRLRAFGFVFQQFNLLPTLNAQENVMAALAPTGMGRDCSRERASSILDEVGLGDRVAHLPSQLSGGEQQRVAIARALANQPRVILADEPTGNLDSATGTEIMRLLLSLSKEHGQTVVVVTHDRDIAELAPRVISMRDGKVLIPDPTPRART